MERGKINQNALNWLSIEINRKLPSPLGGRSQTPEKMAQNQGYFQPQPGQQTQYSPVFQQQPQNIYQQLGKPQPQRTPSFEQQQVVPQGFQFAPQQQQYQAPYALSQTPYVQPQTPYQPSTTPFSAAPQTFAPAQPQYQQPQTAYQQQYVQQSLVPYSVQQQPQQQPAYQQQPQQQLPQQVSVQPQMQLQPQPQQYVQQHPVYQQQQQQQHSQLPTSSFPNQTTSWRPTSSTSSKPPPISPSASLAKQVRAPAAIIPSSAPGFTLVQPPTAIVRAQTLPSPAPPAVQARPTASVQPQLAPGRRPLPQPVPGANTQPPSLPAAGSALRRPPVLPNLNTNTTSTGPFPASSSSLPSQQQQAQRITSPPVSASPTRTSRPLPTPTAASTSGNSTSRRSTVDMGRLPHGSSAMVPSIGPISSNSGHSGSSSTSVSVSNVAANWPPQNQNQNRTPSPTKPVEGGGVGMPLSSRTAGLAFVGGGASTNDNSSPIKRRASPPRFHAQSTSASSSNSVSESSSPVKENASNSNTNPNASSYMPRSTGAASSVSASTSASGVHNSTDVTPKKFTPMWRRTIPEMPAPAWGYAAGMVAEPHPKPKPPAPAPAPAPAPVVAPAEKEKEKGKGKLAKLLRKKKSAPTIVQPAPKSAPVVSSVGAAAPTASAGPKTLNSQYPPAQVHGQYQQRTQQSMQESQQQQQRYANWQPQVKAQALAQGQGQGQGYAMHQRVPAGYVPQRQDEEETEEEEETGEEQTGEEEQTEEEEEETEEEEEEAGQEQRPGLHARQYSHQIQPPPQHQQQYQQQQHPQTPQKQRQAPRAKYQEYQDEYEDEEDTPRKRTATPKKGVLRPKMSPNATYASYNDSSPRRIAEKRAAIEREMEREREREAAPKLRLRPKASAGTRSRALEEAEAQEERVLMSGGRRRGVVSQVPLAGEDGPSRRTGAGRGHERSRSAFDEREAVRHRREPSEVRHVRRPGSAMLAGERRTRRSYDDYDDEEEYATLAYDDSEEEEEEEEEVQYKKKMPKRGTPLRDTRDGDWDRRDVAQHRRYESSPQYGQRTSAPPMNRRSRSGPGGDSRYEDEDDDDEEVEYRASPRRAAPPKAERRYREEEAEDYNRRPSGLPHPPSMGRETSGRDQGAKQPVGASRMGRVKSVPLKQDDMDDQEHYARNNAPQEKPEFTRQFAKMQLRNPNGGQDDRGAPTSADGWPAGLPRLPRTPGSVATPDKGPNGGGGYFDVRPPSNPGPGSSSNFQQGETPKQIRAPNMNNLNLDDPPPRATVVRTPSPGPRGGYTFKRELPQPQGPPQVHTSSQNYPVTADKVSQQLARRRSLYTVPSQPAYQQQQTPAQRPQSQVYSNNGPPPQVQQYASQLGHPPFTNTRIQQTPAPPQPIGIESPHPVGGREKMADIPKMEEDSNHGSDTERSMIPRISVDSPQQRSPRNPQPIPMINVNSSPNVQAPAINVEPPSIQIESDASPRNQHFDQGPKIQVYEVPGISVSGPQFNDHHGGPVISISDPDDHRGNPSQSGQHQHHPASHPPIGQNSGPRTGGLVCGGCHGPIIGRIVSAMGQRYHPACFKCTVCNELLEHVSSYEHEGRPYCHLDYHETFAPRCFSCKTAIVEEQFISLDDPALGKRAYHAQHFFCAECGDPFLSPSAFPTDSRGEFALSGDGEFEGFTVYKGHPYCEACHVRLRLPKCKRCKKSIRDNDEAVEALGGKWCWGCFVCASCQNPFQDPSFFQRDNQPYCEHCFSIMLRNEV